MTSHEKQKRPGVGVGVMVMRKGKLLMQRRTGAHGEGAWSVPGGHMEFGESPEETAAREVLEEANVRIRNPKVVGVTNDIFHKEEKHYVTIFVEAEHESGEACCNDDTSTETKWCDPNDLPAPLFIPLQNFLEKRRLL